MVVASPCACLGPNRREVKGVRDGRCGGKLVRLGGRRGSAEGAPERTGRGTDGWRGQDSGHHRGREKIKLIEEMGLSQPLVQHLPLGFPGTGDKLCGRRPGDLI